MPRPYDVDMDGKDEQRQAKRRLRELLKAAGYAPRPAYAGFQIDLTGEYRSWQFQVVLMDGWLSVYASVMRVPQTPTMRAKLLESLLVLNAEIALVKFTKVCDTVAVELQYREEHLDPAVVRNLVCLIQSLCEEHYPALFRIVSGEENLVKLEEAFQRPSLRGGPEP